MINRKSLLRLTTLAAAAFLTFACATATPSNNSPSTIDLINTGQSSPIQVGDNSVATPATSAIASNATFAPVSAPKGR